MEHTLKCHSKFFNAIQSGVKTFELRFDDRPYSVNDILLLREIHPGRNAYSGRTLKVKITYILRNLDCDFPGLLPGYALLSIRK